MKNFKSEYEECVYKSAIDNKIMEMVEEGWEAKFNEDVEDFNKQNGNLDYRLNALMIEFNLSKNQEQKQEQKQILSFWHKCKNWWNDFKSFLGFSDKNEDPKQSTPQEVQKKENQQKDMTSKQEQNKPQELQKKENQQNTDQGQLVSGTNKTAVGRLQEQRRGNQNQQVGSVR